MTEELVAGGQQRILAALRTLSRFADDTGAARGDGASDLERQCRAVAGLVGARRGAFLRLADDGTSLAPVATHGVGPELLRSVAAAPFDPDRDPRRADEIADDIGARDSMAAPWQAGGRRLGVLIVFDSEREDGFSDEDALVLRVASEATGMVWQHHEAKTNFLNLASHELRGPIGVVRGYLSMIRDGDFGEPDDRMRQPLDMVSAKVDQIWRLVEQMVEATRREESRIALRRDHVDLRSAVATAVDEMRPLAEAGHHLLVHLPAAAVPVEGDQMRLVDVVASLLDNAIKYSPGGGNVWCELGTRGGHAVLAVRDEGLGIAAEDIPKVFTRFGRIVTPENSHIPGSGLGLSHAQALVSMHGGELTVTSTPGAGSTFSVLLPLDG